MGMSHLSPEERNRLDGLAFWIRDEFSARGHNITTALDQDPAFREGERARSGLARSLMQAAVTVATSRVGLGLLTGDGGVRTVQSFDRGCDRRYRVLSAHKDEENHFRILSSSDAILSVDTDNFLPQESWVLAYTLTADNQVDDLFVAPIIDRREGNPGELVLGPEYHLEGAPPSGGGFQPTDEGLPMFDEDDEDGIGAAGAV